MKSESVAAHIVCTPVPRYTIMETKQKLNIFFAAYALHTGIRVSLKIVFLIFLTYTLYIHSYLP